MTTIPADNTISIVDPPASAAKAYPLSTFTYALVPVATSKATSLKRFLQYAIGDGQQFAADLEFATLPAKVIAADKRTIAKLKSG